MTPKISLEGGNLNALMRSLENVADNIPKQQSIITGKVAKKTKSVIAKGVTQELAVKQKTVKEHISTRKTKSRAEVDLAKSARIPLRDFKARQTRKGVSYRISKSKGRRKAPHAFVVDKFGGRVYQRVGKARTPIRQLRGPSPFGVFVGQRLTGPTVDQIQAELAKQTKERIRYLTLKKNGTI